MRLVLVLIVFAYSAASAADFRTLDIGDSCESVPAREQVLASTTVPWNAPEGIIYAFHGSAFDRDLLFTYFCPKGHLFTGNYYFPVEDAEKVQETYRDVRQRLTSIYGSPDSSDLNSDSRQRDAGIQMTTWKTAKLFVTMSIQPNHPNEEQGHRIFVVVAKAI